MAGTQGIEHMPRDALKEIMIRVAGQPRGAADIARAFAVSKRFRDFAGDEGVLRAVSFVDLFPCLAGLQEQEIRMLSSYNQSASMLCNAKMETAHSAASLHQYYNLRDFLKATRLLDHLSAENTNPAKLFDLVRNFLSRARVRDFAEMQCHLKSFVSLYVETGKEPQHQEFLTTLDKLCEKKSFALAFSADPVAYLIRHLNELCRTAHSLMKEMGMDEEVFRPLLQCNIEMNAAVGYETLMEGLDIIEPILKLEGNVASTVGDHAVLLTDRGISCLADMLRGQLKQLMDHEAFIQRAVTYC